MVDPNGSEGRKLAFFDRNGKLKALIALAVTFCVTIEFGYADCEALASGFEKKDPDVELVTKTFESLCRRDIHYAPSECQKNSVKLFFVLKNKIPSLRMKDFSVLLVSTEKGPLDRFTWGGVHRSRTDPAWMWLWHTALSYKGVTLDPDGPVPMKALKDREFEKWLLETNKTLWIWRIPGRVILKPDFQFRMDSLELSRLSSKVTPIKLSADVDTLECEKVLADTED